MQYLFVLIVIVALVILYKRFRAQNSMPVHWEPQEIAQLLQSCIEGETDHKAWDYFESCEIIEPKLDSIRQKALDAFYGSDRDVYIKNVVTDDYLTSEGKVLFARLVAECKVADITTKNT